MFVRHPNDGSAQPHLLLCALQIIHINVRRRQNVSCAEKVETYIYHFSMDPDTSPLEKKRTIANVSYVPWIIPSRCLLTVIMDSTVPIAFLVKWFWRRVIVVMDVLVCVWRLAVPVRILVNAVIGARESKIQRRDRQCDRNNVSHKHIQKGLCRSCWRSQLIVRQRCRVRSECGMWHAYATHMIFSSLVVV